MRYLPAVVCLCLVTLIGCEEKLRPATVAATGELPSQESWRSRVIFTDSARTRAILWAGHIAVFTAGKYTMLDDSVHVDFYNDDGNHTSALTSRRGRVNDATRDFDAYENVIVVSDSGTTLKTQKLYWSNATRTIHTDAYVDIVSPTEHICGTGMVSDEDLKHYRIFQVSGQVVTHE